MTPQEDLEYCRAAIRTGSLSFHAASRLLPSRVSDPSLVLYAFCRLADDAVDEGQDKIKAVLDLAARLDLVYAGRPRNTPVDRCFAEMIEAFEMPRALPEALLEGLAWDANCNRYRSLSDVRSYSARVASSVGVMMCVLMGVRDADVLARACDLGVAMQLTNIARDVGEDARAGRLYLPLNWFEDAGIDPDQFLRDPRPTPEIRSMVDRMLKEAHRLYRRSEPGLGILPLRTRPGIWAARLIYAGIGRAIRENGCDSVSLRARTSKAFKFRCLISAYARSSLGVVVPAPATLHAASLKETEFLVDAACGNARVPGRAEVLIAIMAELKARDSATKRGFVA